MSMARLGPIPWMYRKAYSMRLLPGTSTPINLGMSVFSD